jgi:hypothetical protein
MIFKHHLLAEETTSLRGPSNTRIEFASTPFSLLLQIEFTYPAGEEALGELHCAHRASTF